MKHWIYWSGAKPSSADMDAPIAGSWGCSKNDGDSSGLVCATEPFRSSKALNNCAVSHINCPESVSLVMASHNSCQLRVSTLIVAELLSQMKKRSQPPSSVVPLLYMSCNRPSNVA